MALTDAKFQNSKDRPSSHPATLKILAWNPPHSIAPERRGTIDQLDTFKSGYLP